MDNPPIHTALYAELLRIQRELRQIDKKRTQLEAERDSLAGCEMHLRSLMMDYGDFVYEDYKPKEEPDNA